MAKNYKDVENRNKSLPKDIAFYLPVRIYLHASLRPAGYDDKQFIIHNLTKEQCNEFYDVNWNTLRGKIIGEITITKQMRKFSYVESDHIDIGSQQKDLELLIKNKDACMSRWFFGKFGYAVKDGILYDNPIPYKGQLGFFEVAIPPISTTIDEKQNEEK